MSTALAKRQNTTTLAARQQTHAPDDDVASSQTAPVTVHITMFDWNRKKPHQLIGEVTVTLSVGSGRISVEMPSQCVSPLRPFIEFR